MKKRAKPATVHDLLGGGEFARTVGVRVEGEPTPEAVAYRLLRADKKQPNVAVVSALESGFRVELFRTSSDGWDGRGEEEVSTPHQVAVLLSKYGGGLDAEPTIPAEILPPESLEPSEHESLA